MTEIETGGETIIIATGEGLPADTGADLLMTTVEAGVATMTVAAMTTDLPEEDLVGGDLLLMIRITINMDLRAHGVVIPTVHPAVGVAHRHSAEAEVVVVVVAAIATAGTRMIREFPSWFATLAHTSPTTTSARHSDASVTFVMFTFQGIITRSKRKVSPLSNTRIPTVSTEIHFLMERRDIDFSPLAVHCRLIFFAFFCVHICIADHRGSRGTR